MNRSAILFLSLVATLHASAQVCYTLDDCLKAAIDRSPQIRQAEMARDMAAVAYGQTLSDYLPDVVLRNERTCSAGQSDYGASLEASALIFSGFGRVQSRRKAKTAVESGIIEMRLARSTVSLDISALFYKILQDKEMIAINENRLSLLSEQEKLIGRKVSLKAAVQSDLTSVHADMAGVRSELQSAVRDYNSDRISICELLGIEDWRNFDVEDDDSIRIAETVVDVEAMPQLQIAALQTHMAEREIGIAKSVLWPEMLLGAGISCNKAENWNRYLCVSVEIPVTRIVSGIRDVRMKRLSLAVEQSKEDETRLAVDSQLKLAVSELESAYDRYGLLMSEQELYAAVLSDARRKYELGAATYFECQTAMSSLYQAQSRLAQSKYECLLRMRVLRILLDSGK